MKEWTKKTKMTVVLGVLAITLAGGGVYAYASNQSKITAAQTEITAQETVLKELNRELKGYFDKESPSYLVENMQEKQISDFRKAVDKETTPKKTDLKVDLSAFKTEAKEVEKTMVALENTFGQQQAINKLFQKTAINGSKITKDLPIADDLKQETVDQVKKSVEKPASDFEKSVLSLATEAENQLKQIDKAKQATAKVYKDKVVSTDAKLYDTAKAETEKIKNSKAKKALNDQLANVKTDIDKKSTEAEKKETEVKVADAADKSQQQQNAITATDTQAVTDQGAAAPDYSGVGGNVDTGGYTPQGNADPGYQQPQYQAPAQQETQTPQAPATGGGGQGQNPPTTNNNNNTTWDKPTETTPNANGGEDNYWGFD